MKTRILIGAMLVVVIMWAGCGTSPEPKTPTPIPPTPTATSIPPGAISGHIVGADTSDPLGDAQIVLCLLPETTAEGFLCTLQSDLTALSDASGAFSLLDVPPGSYVLVYGFTNELVSGSDEWKGVKITRAQPCLKNMINEVCQSSEAGEGVFWQAGGTYIGEAIFALKEPDEIEATVIYSKGAYTLQGAVRSDSLGISIMIQGGKLAPIVRVRPEETTEIEWQVLGR